MSKNQEQFGKYTFNKSNFTKTSVKLRKLFNDYHDYSYAVALGVYEYLKVNKVKLDDVRSCYGLNIDSSTLKNTSQVRSALQQLKINHRHFDVCSDLMDFMFDEIYRSKTNKNAILKPRRSAFPKITNKEKSFSIYFPIRELTISANSDNLSFTWKIEMNNRNVDRVENGFYSALLFPILNEHKWGRGEGGYVKTTEESMSDYDLDDRYNTSYSSYLGKIGEEQKAYINRMLNARFR
ncbi:hypothetical protein LMH73_013825 [Vibrio splendidus]|nr:hypothetical protein [Vibrio splendidus]MCC4883069.1 hypothetical protein [Vibrio splendidus]